MKKRILVSALGLVVAMSFQLFGQLRLWIGK